MSHPFDSALPDTRDSSEERATLDSFPAATSPAPHPAPLFSVAAVDPFRHEYQRFVYTRTYSRWIDELGRRETWEETVNRLVTFFKEERGDRIPSPVLEKIRRYIRALDCMPSMRMLWAAGDAARADNTTIYNCSFLVISSVDDFAEMLHILMCGTGVGFSVSKADVAGLPAVPAEIEEPSRTLRIEDSRSGWAESLRSLMNSLYAGADVAMDYSDVRPKGSRLKTMGGRSSGPDPLRRLHEYVRDLFKNARGRSLTTVECHDIACQIAEVVVVGGVRRSSLISLSDLADDAMRDAKIYPFPVRRQMANNSAIYDEKPSPEDFAKEWAALASSGSGERGLFNRQAARKNAPARRLGDLIMGTNPCGEIALRHRGFCNLSEVVVRATDSLQDLLDKVEVAVWIGVVQSTFTHFPYLSPDWKRNCEDERLLGVSLTGQFDAPHLMTESNLERLKARALEVARQASATMGVSMPAAVTCTKPSGTVSQLVDSASGIHPRYSDFYIRRYRISSVDPLYAVLRASGIPASPENGEREKDWTKAGEILAGGGSEMDANKVCKIFRPGETWAADKVTTWVVSFPVASPASAVTVDQVSAMDQLEWYRKVQTKWCEHNASVTVYVRDGEWDQVGAWVYENWELAVGISFLPYDSGAYEQLPYERISREEYERLASEMPLVDYSLMARFEKDDGTSGAKSLACAGGSCDV